MSVTFDPVLSSQQIEELAAMAEQIWNEYWPPLIGKGQTCYMVQKYQSIQAIERDMRDCSYRYWFVVDERGKRVGYTGGATEIAVDNRERDEEACHNAEVQRRWARRFFISKIYLYASERGKHYSSQIVRFLEDLCRKEGLQVMYLTVNKGNELGIRAYIGNGFELVDSQVVDIGCGFAMDDYVMAKEIAKEIA